MWVSAQMGHKDWGFTARTYAKFIDSDQASAGSKLEASQRDQKTNLGGYWLERRQINRRRKNGKEAMQPLEHQTNVFGDPLQSCSMDPLTGFFRTGCCDADSEDLGKHFVCARVHDDFLQYSLSQGNDLITARPEFGFAGLKSGDQWCVCAIRWLEAFDAGCAPPVVLTSTNSKVLGLVDLETLKVHAVDIN